MNKTKNMLRKLEFGIIELFVGALMLIGLIGYFGSVPADLDWIDHTVSFILFSYLFYKLDITSILFGKSSKFANAMIIISCFSLFFKDIIIYTSLDAFKFKFITFVDYFYKLFHDNFLITNIAAFYFGIAGMLLISIYIAKKIEVSRPSLLHALHQKQIKSKLIIFLWAFVLLLGFYYFVYNMILEWLEFTLDDPVIATGIIFYIAKIAKHHEKFHPNNFIFKIGNFSTRLYKRLISLFHYKKTLPLAISGLLILHSLSDLGVFAYSLVFFKENFYLGLLRHEHSPFLKLFLDDVKNVPSFAAIPLFIAYVLNAASLVVFLLIPVVVWAIMFSQKGLHFGRIILFFVYSSAVAYMLLPGYIIEPISRLSIKGAAAGEDKSIAGVDVLSVPLLESKSVLENLFPNKMAIVIAVPLISILFGLAVYILSSNDKVKKELYALSIIGGLTFYGIYLFYFFGSTMSYFYDNISISIFTPNFLIGIMLAVFLALSIIFYAGGYLMFLYEIVKMRKIERKVIKPRKAQLIGEVLKYGIVGVVSIIMLIAGYQMVNVIKERACKTEIAKFEIDLRDMDKSLRYGVKELRSYDAPCKADKIYFFDLNKEINPENFKDIPIIKDTLKGRGSSNVFLVKDGEVKRSFHAGSLEMVYPYHICFIPKFDKISFFIEGAGKSARIASACDQPECTFIPINISEEDTKKIVQEAFEFGCQNCPTDLEKEMENIKLTRKNIDMFRKFTFCEGVTTVEILIRPKKNVQIKDFRFYEFIPKTCIDNLNKYLAEEIKTDADINLEIKNDPLILWHFDVLKKDTTVSYKLNKLLDEECTQLIQGLGVAQFIERGVQQVGLVTPTESTIPSTSQPLSQQPGILRFLPLPREELQGSRRKFEKNLWRYTDYDGNKQDLVYRVLNPDTELFRCRIKSEGESDEKILECERKENVEGSSDIEIEVSDGTLTNRGAFTIAVDSRQSETEDREHRENSNTQSSVSPIGQRSLADRPDDFSGNQVHFMYVLPSDGIDQNLDTNSQLVSSVNSFQRWLREQTGGKQLRIDTYQGALDITFYRLSRTDAQIKSYGAYVRDQIESELSAAGFNNANKIYAVYYGGGSNYACGGSSWPPTLPGRVVAMYLLGTPPNAAPCNTNAFVCSSCYPGYWEFAMLHDLLHSLGVVATCAPHHTLAGHVSDSNSDLMYAGNLPWNYANMRFDVGNDDYYGHGNENCPDLLINPYIMQASS